MKRFFLFSIIPTCFVLGCSGGNFDTAEPIQAETSADALPQDAQQDSVTAETTVDSSQLDSAMEVPDSKESDTNTVTDTKTPSTLTGVSCGLGICAIGQVCCLSSGKETCRATCDVGETTVECANSSNCPSSNPICCAQFTTLKTCCFADTCGLKDCSGTTVTCAAWKPVTSTCQASACPPSNYSVDDCVTNGKPLVAQACNSATDCVTGSCCRPKGETKANRICGTPQDRFDDCL